MTAAPPKRGWGDQRQIVWLIAKCSKWPIVYHQFSPSLRQKFEVRLRKVYAWNFQEHEIKHFKKV